MKTQVIQLDEHDDVISVRDRMSWTKTPRLLLVFPRHGRILDRTLDLRLLKRHALGLGAQLALVTRSGDVRTAAGELEIPVFTTSVQAQRSAWPVPSASPRPRRPVAHAEVRRRHAEGLPVEAGWRSLPVVRLGVFSLAVLSLLVLLVLFLPSATITLVPRSQTQKLVLELNASQAESSVNLAGSLPAHTDTLVVEGSKTAPVTGRARLPDQPAQGTVRFRNLTIQAVGIPTGTVVRTTASPLQRFATTADGVLAGGVGQTIDVPVRALAAGSGGNLPADSLVAIEGSLGLSMSAANPEATAGGTDRSTAIATAADRSGLHDALLANLRKQALLQLPQSLEDGDVIFPQSLVVEQVISETYIPAEGQPGEELTLTMQVQVQVQYARGADVQTLAAAVMNASLPEGYAPRPAPITTTVSAEPATGSDGLSTWQMTAERPVFARLDPVRAAQLVQGMRLSFAKQKLSRVLLLASPPVIGPIPNWWPWLPWLSFRIMVTVQ